MSPQATLNPNPAPNYPRPVPDQHARHRIRQLLDSVTHHCHAVERAGAAETTAAARLRAADEARNAQPPHAGLYTLMAVVILLGAAAFDTIVSGSMLEYFAGQQLHLSPAGQERVRWLGPWLVLALETALAIRILHERRERLPGQGALTPSMGWAALLVTALLGMAITTSIARYPDEPGQAVIRFWAQTLTLVVLTLLTHSIVLGSGAILETAWNFGGVALRHQSAGSEVARERSASVASSSVARQSFDLYYQEREHYNERYPASPIPSGPFDETTRRTLNRLYGRVVVAGTDEAPGAPHLARMPPMPPVPPAATPPRNPDPAPPPPEPAAEDAESSYLRHALDAMVRNRDSELVADPPASPNPTNGGKQS